MERGDLAKIVIAVLLFLFLIFLGTQIYTYNLRAGEAQNTYDAAKARLDAANKDQAQLSSDLEYYSNPYNLEKEIKARFNYQSPDEKMLILVPEATSSQ